MRRGIIALMLLCGSIGSALAQVSVDVGINLPGVSIGIDIPSYPRLVRVPSYPVYYAPGLGANFFFYDGMYWVYESDRWYASSWYNGPWSVVGPEFVPVYVLRVPVRYYVDPPVYFRGWRPDAPPRWGEHWGRGWEQQRHGWDRWNRSAAPAPAPLPIYQRQYGGNRYPRVEQQQALRSQNYRYQPRDAVVRQHFQQQAGPRGPATARGREMAPREPRSGNAMPGDPGTARANPPPRGRESVQRPARLPERVPQGHAAPPEAARHQVPARPEPPAARSVPRGPEQGTRAPQQSPGRGQGQGQEKDRERGEGRGQDHRN